jgi:hypothetical protein
MVDFSQMPVVCANIFDKKSIAREIFSLSLSVLAQSVSKYFSRDTFFVEDVCADDWHLRKRAHNTGKRTYKIFVEPERAGAVGIRQDLLVFWYAGSLLTDSRSPCCLPRTFGLPSGNNVPIAPPPERQRNGRVFSDIESKVDGSGIEPIAKFGPTSSSRPVNLGFYVREDPTALAIFNFFYSTTA